MTSPRPPRVLCWDQMGPTWRNSFPLLRVSCKGPLWPRQPGLRPVSEAVPSRGALGAPGRPFRQPGAASFEPLLFVAGLSWPGKGERRRSSGELPGAGWTGGQPPPPGRGGSGAAGRGFVLRPPRRSPPRPRSGTRPRGAPSWAAGER